MRAVQVVGVVLLLTGACTKPNPDYCDDSSTCTGGLVCNVAIHTCEVQMDASTSCSSNDQCIDPANPVCGEMQTCRACGLDDECTSGVCLADGRCEDAGSILYVSTSGISAGQCPADAACDLSYALTLVTDVRKTIRVAIGSYMLPGAVLVSPPINDLTIVGGRGAVLARNSSGPSFDVRNGATFTLRGVTMNRGLECSGLGAITVERVLFTAPGSEVRSWIVATCDVTVTDSELLDSTLHGIETVVGGAHNLSVSRTRISKSQGAGIKTESVQFTMTRSEVTESMDVGVYGTAQYCTVSRSIIASNRQGGVLCTGRYDVTNNFVFRNGNNVNAPFGGLRLESNYAGNRVAHNTVVQNTRAYSTTPPVYAGGVYCTNGTAPNNLVVDNEHGNEQDPSAQKAGTCDFIGSVIGTEVNSDPYHFVEPYITPVDYHLADDTSPAVNAGAALLIPLAEDFDGDLRSDGLPDVGADERVP